MIYKCKSQILERNRGSDCCQHNLQHRLRLGYPRGRAARFACSTLLFAVLESGDAFGVFLAVAHWVGHFSSMHCWGQRGQQQSKPRRRGQLRCLRWRLRILLCRLRPDCPFQEDKKSNMIALIHTSFHSLQEQDAFGVLLTVGVQNILEFEIIGEPIMIQSLCIKEFQSFSKEP